MSKFWASSNNNCVSSSSSLETSIIDAISQDGDVDDGDGDSKPSWGNSASTILQHETQPTTIDYSHSDLPDEAWRQIGGNQLFLPLPITPSGRPVNPGCIRIVCTSNTHGRHRDVAIPNGNILIHAGDFTKSGEIGTVQEMSKMFSDLQSRFDDILCIAGNHEVTFDHGYYKGVWQAFHRKPINTMDARDALQNCIYLENQAVAVRDLIVYGSPFTPEYESSSCRP